MSFDLKISNDLGDFAYLNHDVSWDSLGRLVTVSGVNKLYQDIQKILFTTTNYFYNQYGTDISTLIGSKLNPQIIVNDLNTRVTSSLNYLMNLQLAQSKYQNVNATEIIQSIITIKAAYVYETTGNSADLSRFSVIIVVQNAAGQTVNVSRNISLN